MLTRTAGLVAAMVVALLIGAAGAQARIAVASNWRLGADDTPGRGKDSVGFAVDPSDGRHIVEVQADWLAGKCQWNVSFDGGQTWKGGSFKVPAGFDPVPCTVGPHLAAHMQAGVAYGSGKNVYATFASPKPLSGGLEMGKSLFLAVSRDGGKTFATAQELAAGGPSASEGPDYTLPTIGVERGTKGTSGDHVYVAATSSEASHDQAVSNENVLMVVSGDSGRTWGKPFDVNTPQEHALEQSRIAVGRAGKVYIAWRDRGQAADGTFTPEGTLVLARSTDHGATWNRFKIADVRGYVYQGPPVPPFNAGGTFTASSFPRIAADPRNNNVYVVYGQGPPQVPTAAAARAKRGAKAKAADHFINPGQQVYFQRSTDAGQTWSKPDQLDHPAKINTELLQTRHPWVEVASNGRVDVAWQDRRHWYRGCTNTHVACTEARLGDTYYAYSSDAGKSFSRNYRLSDRSTNNDVGFDYRFGTYWAYGPNIAETGDNQLLVGWMDSREGNVQTDSQDIYLTRVRLNSTAPVPVRRGRPPPRGGGFPGAGVRLNSTAPVPVRRVRPRSGSVDFSVAMSRLGYPGGPEAVLAATFASRPWTRIVIANENDVAGALAGGVLARMGLSSVLLSPPGGLPPNVKAEVRRMAPVGAYVLGDQGRLSAQVVNDLVAAGIPADQVVRISGDAPATAAQIATTMDQRTTDEKSAGRPAFDAAIIANPSTRDAVTAATLAAERRLPVLYVSRDGVPAATADALKSLNIAKALVVGDTKAVGATVAGQLPAAQRLAGVDMDATSRMVASEARRRGLPDNVVYVSDGRSRMQTALMGPAVARIGALQMVARGGASDALERIAASKSLRASVTGVVAVVPR